MSNVVCCLFVVCLWSSYKKTACLLLASFYLIVNSYNSYLTATLQPPNIYLACVSSKKNPQHTRNKKRTGLKCLLVLVSISQRYYKHETNFFIWFEFHWLSHCDSHINSIKIVLNIKNESFRELVCKENLDIDLNTYYGL